MENIKEYIESGILELYVLGSISPDEKLQVEKMAAENAEVKVEIEAIERSMEAYAEVHAIAPPEVLRGRILNSLLTNLADDRIFTKAHSRTEEVFEDDDVEAENVIAMPVRQPSFFKYAFAACLVLLLISVYGLINLYSKLQDTNTQLTAMQLDKQKIANDVSNREKELNIYRDTVYRILRLKGTPKTPTAAMTIAWNTINKKIVLDMKSMKLPEHDSAHQYQLWALVGGKPVDLGVFDSANAIDTSGVKEMKAIAAADAFAVTVEPMGGSVNPTITEMVVSGASK
ncbi:anti-sigma factor [Mucilaginibacter psychrotolerans]|uniref:Regulator of SigK n=1 Tax=Mucilaginibacter psychrotolerans TaxID=1524096 RepID=A0A4Y8S5P6_9SPHI|nr:anti-sigma factor [Mucilaginibacter psychrotolerans]TFF34298.1 anti-sigma factor [Mucilaginibacter psychrotolerans]